MILEVKNSLKVKIKILNKKIYMVIAETDWNSRVRINLQIEFFFLIDRVRVKNNTF